MDTPNPVKNNIESINDHYGLEDEDVLHPNNYKAIMPNHHKDKELIKITKRNKNYSIQNFHLANKKYSLIGNNRKIVILNQLEKQVVEWHHNKLCHPRETHTELNVSQHFYWKNLRKTVRGILTRYKTCQILKRNKKQYRKLPLKEVETIPWDTLCVDLIG